ATVGQQEVTLDGADRVQEQTWALELGGERLEFPGAGCHPLGERESGLAHHAANRARESVPVLHRHRLGRAGVHLRNRIRVGLALELLDQIPATPERAYREDR